MSVDIDGVNELYRLFDQLEDINSPIPSSPALSITPVPNMNTSGPSTVQPRSTNQGNNAGTISPPPEERFSRPFLPAISRLWGRRHIWTNRLHELRALLVEIFVPDRYAVASLVLTLLPIPFLYYPELERFVVGLGGWLGRRFAWARR